ncbi:hypothetical protein M8C21_021315 [Ambrosia artemisiifolia]|uniref:Uncharacterized protein n=1 Tax=Ambrosia artemisiifolia TaxID=4212 RepID=A0AAD5C1G3_AMBAR|nr:hypothetical protein M8C21_021315 [Ambrosia artemisiifolia]
MLDKEYNLESWMIILVLCLQADHEPKIGRATGRLTWIGSFVDLITNGFDWSCGGATQLEVRGYGGDVIGQGRQRQWSGLPTKVPIKGSQGTMVTRVRVPVGLRWSQWWFVSCGGYKEDGWKHCHYGEVVVVVITVSKVVDGDNRFHLEDGSMGASS